VTPLLVLPDGSLANIRGVGKENSPRSGTKNETFERLRQEREK
jgi:hypothetical protein